jgi:hypothetical protein
MTCLLETPGNFEAWRETDEWKAAFKDGQEAELEPDHKSGRRLEPEAQGSPAEGQELSRPPQGIGYGQGVDWPCAQGGISAEDLPELGAGAEFEAEGNEMELASYRTGR